MLTAFVLLLLVLRPRLDFLLREFFFLSVVLLEGAEVRSRVDERERPPSIVLPARVTLPFLSRVMRDPSAGRRAMSRYDRRRGAQSLRRRGCPRRILDAT